MCFQVTKRFKDLKKRSRKMYLASRDFSTKRKKRKGFFKMGNTVPVNFGNTFISLL